MDQTPQDILQSLVSLDPSLIMENRGHLFPYGYPQRQYPNQLAHSVNTLHPPSSFTDVPQVPQPSCSIPPAPHHILDSSRNLLAPQISLSQDASGLCDIRPFPNQFTNHTGKMTRAPDERNTNARSVIINHRIPIDANHPRNAQELNELNTQSVGARIYNPVRNSSDDYKYSHSDDKFDRIPTISVPKSNESFNEISHPKCTKIASLSLGIDVNCSTSAESHHQIIQNSRASFTVHDPISLKPNLFGENQSISSKSEKFSVNMIESRLSEIENSEHYRESSDNPRNLVSNIEDLSTTKKHYEDFQSNNPSVARISESSSKSVPAISTSNLKLGDGEYFRYSNINRPNTSLESLSHILDQHLDGKDKSKQITNMKDSDRNISSVKESVSEQISEKSTIKKIGKEVSAKNSKIYGKGNIEDDNEATDRFFNISNIVKPVDRFHCDECDASYSTKGNLKMHKKTHGGTQFICDFCEKPFFHRHQLERHRRQHTGEKPFKCSECEASFVARESLTRHTRNKHTGERPYKCNVCDATFSMSDHYSRHCRIHTGEKPYKCEHCSMAFAYKSTFISHQFEHTDTEFKCEECGKIFKDPLGLQRHSKKHQIQPPNPNEVKVVRDRDKKFTCEFCEKKFEKKSHFIIHRRMHTGERPFVCETCNAGFVKRSYLIIHMRNHTGERPFKCDKCDHTYKCRAGLRIHLRTHMEIKPYKCEICDFRFAQKANLNSHMLIHTGDKPFKCDVCGTSFRQRNSLKKHKRTHTGEKPYKCDECETSFAQKSDIRLHKKRIHSGNKPYACDECNSSFFKQGFLMAHKLQQHASGKGLESSSSHDPSDKDLKCTECEISLPNEFSFMVHMRKHNGKKPFVCSDCGASFLHCSRLEAHRRQHTGEKPYKCDKCDAAFTLKAKLTTHSRKHSNERPFKCEECEASFKEKRNLFIHYRTHTGEIPYKCEECGKAYRDRANLYRHKKTHTRKSRKPSSPPRKLEVEPEKLPVTNDIDPLSIKEEPQDTATTDIGECLPLVPMVEIKVETEEREEHDNGIDSKIA